MPPGARDRRRERGINAGIAIVAGSEGIIVRIAIVPDRRRELNLLARNRNPSGLRHSDKAISFKSDLPQPQQQARLETQAYCHHSSLYLSAPKGVSVPSREV